MMSDFHPDLSYTTDRELSWLKFDMRVLGAAADSRIPPLERLRFLSIFSTNLDEFFMVRVGGLEDKAILSPDETDDKSGLTPAEELKAIYGTVPGMIEQRDRTYKKIIRKLAGLGVTLVPYRRLKKKDKEFIDSYYEAHIRPMLSPLVVERAHPFPHLKNKASYAAALLTSLSGGNKKILGLVEVPESIPPLVYLSTDEEIRFVRTEDIIAAKLEKLFKRYRVLEKAIVSVTRNADIGLSNAETESKNPRFREHMENLLRARDRLAPLRLEVEGDADALAKALAKKLSLNKNQIYFSFCPATLKWAYSIAADRSDLLYPAYTPCWPAYLDRLRPMKAEIEKRDVLLFYPYHSMQPFLRLLGEAAIDRRVTSISITLYRVARDSEVIKRLIEAAESGKEVTVLVELRARFDEENNIGWTRVLERAGCHLIYGVPDYKCHSKICLIRYQHRGRVSYITQIGTGNYNERTAAQYTDFSLMTSDEAVGRDAESFFANMREGRVDASYDKLLIAPRDMKPRLIDLIDREASKGTDGRIIIKTNAVTERDIIDALARASEAGVSIDLIVRGICCLVPGVPGHTSHIRVTSIVGRFLEHSRIYSFGRGADQAIYISSADIMTRNQMRRVEIACPVESDELKLWFNYYLVLLLNDNVNSSRLVYPGKYIKKSTDKHHPIDVHQYYIDHGVSPAPSPRRGPGLISGIRRLIHP